MAKRVLNKKCNVVTKGNAIITSSRRIVGSLKETYLTAGEIIQCLQHKALVEEILIDGTTLPLNIHNYDKDNNANIRGSQKPEVKAAPKVEIPKEPVVVDVVRDKLEKVITGEADEILNPIGLTPVEPEDLTPVEVQEEDEVPETAPVAMAMFEPAVEEVQEEVEVILEEEEESVEEVVVEETTVEATPTEYPSEEE